jgi:hypothetical protein
MTKQITITFNFSKDVEKEFNDKLIDLMSMEGVLYGIHESQDNDRIIQSNKIEIHEEVKIV